MTVLGVMSRLVLVVVNGINWWYVLFIWEICIVELAEDPGGKKPEFMYSSKLSAV